MISQARILTAAEAYAGVKDLPIIDWHNHLDVGMLRANRPLGSLYDVWVKSDPYKHRAMRICGECERDITGDAPESAKWAAWMRTFPKLVGNPLFSWSQSELAFLGLPTDGRMVENVSLADWTPRALLKAFKVEYVSPCVAPPDDLSLFADRMDDLIVAPSLRLDAATLAAADTLVARMAEFHAAGCRVVDISVDDADVLNAKDDTLRGVAGEASRLGWTMLLHLGALRRTSARLRVVAGPAGGFAGMRAPFDPAAVAAFLDGCESGAGLPRTVLLSLNPEAHAQLAVLAGAFVEDGIPGKVQLGPAWWWCDHAEGIRDVLSKNAAYGVLSTFIGMTTDSRSLLSFARHDYFRRVLCRWVAEKVTQGELPDDESVLRSMLENMVLLPS